MRSLRKAAVLLGLFVFVSGEVSPPESLDEFSAFDGAEVDIDPAKYSGACPEYGQYATHAHRPWSDGPLNLPYQRPHKYCRTFHSSHVEKVIRDITERMVDPDLARIFQNAFPNTLDTTVRWHVDGVTTHAPKSKLARDQDRWKGAQSFIVTGDINAEWLRDSTNQLAQYQALAKSAPEIENLILGAINTQAEFVRESAYCNAFQPPSPSRLEPTHMGTDDAVTPNYEPSFVFECKYEIDSLANFLSLANQFHASTGSTAFLTPTWYDAIDALLEVVKQQAQSTFDTETHAYVRNRYTFKRQTNTGTETLNLDGVGNPLASNTGLIRSAFRPSDDATTFGFFIPGNAMLSVELGRTSALLSKVAATSQTTETNITALASTLQTLSQSIRSAIYKHAIITHPIHGRVFAFEIDGYGSQILMDDANIPSLLSLPLLGFLNASDPIYINTRRMILSSATNPYFLSGPAFSGIGGPHIGLRNAWPMSVLVRALTSDDEEEVRGCLEAVRNVSRMGLVNESTNVKTGWEGSTRAWFVWANSAFAQTVLDVAERMPKVLFGKDTPYRVGEGWVER